jgi:hypothetical protein
MLLKCTLCKWPEPQRSGLNGRWDMGSSNLTKLSLLVEHNLPFSVLCRWQSLESV